MSETNASGERSGGDAIVVRLSLLQNLKRYWPVVAVLVIILFGMHIRLFGYFTPDGDTRWPYLRNIDSYFFLREVQDMISNGGHLNPVDGLRLAPLTPGNEFPRAATLYTIIAANLFLVAFSSSSVPIFMAWFPAFLAALVAIPMYLIGRYLFDRKAGVLAALFMTLSVSFMSRTLGGDPDSDAIAMLMAMSSIAAFLAMYKYLNKEKLFTKRNIVLAVLTGFFLAIFAYTWSGYWFSFWIIGTFIVLKIAADFLLHRKHKESHIRMVWKHTKCLLVLTVVAVIVFEALTVPYFGSKFALDFVSQPLSSVFGGGYKGETGQFPNVLVSVAEAQAGGDARAVAVNAAGLDTAASVSGLPLALLTLVSPFLLTLACFAYLGYSYYKRREHLDTLLFTGVWFFGFLFASIVAVRFTIFLAPAYAICSAIMLAKLWRIAADEDRSLGA